MTGTKQILDAQREALAATIQPRLRCPLQADSFRQPAFGPASRRISNHWS